MATLYRRGKTWWAYTCSGTKRLRWSLETTDERIARQKLRKIEYQQDTGELELPSHTPIDLFLQAFCEHLETIRSRKAYKNDLSYLRIFFGAVCEALKPGCTTIRTISRRGCGRSTIPRSWNGAVWTFGTPLAASSR